MTNSDIEKDLERIDSLNPFTGKRIREFIRLQEARIERAENMSTAYQGDLARVSGRHERFLELLNIRYQCPPTNLTAETCKGKEHCRECWCAWAESEGA